MTRSKGRSGRPWRRLQRKILTESRVCWLCGYEIDMRLPATHAMSATVDHVVPLSQGGNPLDPTNLRPAHRRCNSVKGDRPALPRTPTSRAW